VNRSGTAAIRRAEPESRLEAVSHDQPIPSARGGAVPLVVAVTGHRDLVPAEIPRIRERVQDFLRELQHRYAYRSVGVMSALAEGADQLVAEEALALGIPLTVTMPMPKALYLQDFVTPEARARFERLCAQAVDVFELPITPGNSVESISGPGPNRSRQYAQVGVFMCAHCHVLLALWDGKDSDQLGGTSQVVRFHHDDVMPGFTPRGAAGRLVLADDESDLVYHIVCSRDRPGGAPVAGLAPLEASWYTSDDRQPRVAELPARHRLVFDRTNEFSGDIRLHADDIAAGKYPLLTPEQAATMPKGLRDIDQLFCAADWLAIHFQKRVQRTLLATHVCVFLTGFAYLSYTDFKSDRKFILLVLAAMAIAMLINSLAQRGAWQRKYLDNRTLAEGLRVQFYWAASGVTSGIVSKFAHDNFLQMQDPELGWIRNVMRVAGTECDVAPNRSSEGLEFAVREWIGDPASGQLGYFARGSSKRLRHQVLTQRVGRVGLWVTAAALAVLLFVGAGIPWGVRQPLVYLVGCVLLLVGVRQAYAKATAEAELIKQYEFMHRIFHNARRRIDATDSDDERRRVLKILGDAALEEHSEWLLLHRERSMDQKEILRL
jgi:hypothetical protein